MLENPFGFRPSFARAFLASSYLMFAAMERDTTPQSLRSPIFVFVARFSW